ncbi:MAG: hypothetical protein ACOYK9_02470 [Chlamydiia bacterium]
MHAVNLLNFSQESPPSAEESIESHVTKKLLMEVQQSPTKRWNAKIETMVIKKVLPDLVEKFSCIQETETLIKKSIERAVKHVKLLYNQKGAVKTGGHINVPLMLQNCIQTGKLDSTKQAYEHALLEAKTLSAFFIPTHQDEQIEEKVARAIFSIEQHVCTSKSPSCPFEKLDPIDYLILQQQFDLLSGYEVIQYDELQKQVLIELQEHEKIAHMEHLSVLIASTHAHHLGKAIDFEKRWGKKSVDALHRFVSKQLKLYPMMHPIELVNRIVFLYHVSCKKEQKGEIVAAASDYLRSLSTDLYTPTLHRLGHEVYNFINNEIRKIKSNRPLTTLKEILVEVQQMFSFVDDVVSLPQNQKDLLEVFIFSHFYDHHPIMSPLTAHQKGLLARQVSRIAVEKGGKEFRDTVHTAHARLARYKNLCIPSTDASKRSDENFFAQETLIDKISHFASQNELAIDQYKISADHPLSKAVKKFTTKEEACPLSPSDISQILDKFLKEHPLLTGYKSYFEKEAIFLHKAFWYTQAKKGQKTPFERFYQWHYSLLKNSMPGIKGRELIKKMEELTTSTLPLMPSYKLLHSQGM